MRKLQYTSGWLALAVCCSVGSLGCSERFNAQEKGREAILQGVALDGYPLSEARVAEVSNRLGATPNLFLFFLQWPDLQSPQQFDPPLETLNAIWDKGALPILTWEPMFYREGKEYTIAAEEILSGKYDAYLTQFAEFLKQHPRPLLIRFAHEMNFNRYHWGIPTQEQFDQRSPQIYRDIYRYVVNFMRRHEVTSVSWVFCPNAESVPWPEPARNTSWNSLAAYYPGDEFVDVLGIDGYDWGDTLHDQTTGWRSAHRTFEQIVAEPVRALRALNTSKPLIVFETATVRQGDARRHWYEAAVESAREMDLTGIVWFHVTKEHDWRLPDGIYTGTSRTFRRNKDIVLQASKTSDPLIKLFEGFRGK